MFRISNLGKEKGSELIRDFENNNNKKINLEKPEKAITILNVDKEKLTTLPTSNFLTK